jgi:hypothetical protein
MQFQGLRGLLLLLLLLWSLIAHPCPYICRYAGYEFPVVN